VNDEPDNSTEQPHGADVGHVVGGAPAGNHGLGQPPLFTPSGTEAREQDISTPGAPGDELALPDEEEGAEDDEVEEDAGDEDEQEQLATDEISAGGDSDGGSSNGHGAGGGSADSGGSAGGGDAIEPEPEPRKLDWFILKVQSNREDSIRESLLRRINVAGLGESFDQIIVPIEKVSEFKNGKKRVVKRKLYPGYLVVHMEYNDDTWYLVRETPGIGDFTGSGGKPTPMAPHEVSKIISIIEPDKEQETPRLMIPFKKGERVKITEGTFENFEGEVDNIDEANGRVTVMINIFGRSTPVELEYWQIDKL
jgi:transcriptional antiterminator NusG